MNHRCAIHPCEIDAPKGHSTCELHRKLETRLLSSYYAHLTSAEDAEERRAAESQAVDEWRKRAGIEARVKEIIAERRGGK